jgi:parallel beta-helix repeat protein
MNHELPPDLREHLDGVLNQAPDPANVIVAARLEIQQTPQQRGFLPLITARFPTMFSAAKFVVAGVIVALFAGFLLAGVYSEPTRDPGAAVDATHVVVQDGSGDFPTITEAVEAAKDGDTIFVKPGTYVESISIDKDITLTGDGPREDIVIEAPEGGPTSPTGTFSSYATGDAPYAVLLKDAAATLSGLTFRGERSQVHANGGAPVLEDLFFDEVGRTFRGDWVGGGVTLRAGTTARFLANTLTGGGSIVIYDGSDPLIEGNTLTGGPYIVGHLGDAAIIRTNTVSGASQFGIAIFEPTTALVEGNTITDVRTGIKFGESTQGAGVDPVISDNTISARTGIRIVGGNPTVLANTLVDNETAIAMSGSNAHVADNDLLDNGVGISVVGGSPTLDGNTVRDGTTGIAVSGSTSTPIVTGNTVCDNETNMAFSQGAAMPAPGTNDICPDLQVEASE